MADVRGGSRLSLLKSRKLNVYNDHFIRSILRGEEFGATLLQIMKFWPRLWNERRLNSALGLVVLWVMKILFLFYFKFEWFVAENKPRKVVLIIWLANAVDDGNFKWLCFDFSLQNGNCHSSITLFSVIALEKFAQTSKWDTRFEASHVLLCIAEFIASLFCLRAI